MVGGIHCKILVAHTKLCASRAFWLSAYPTQKSHEMLFDAHARAFTTLGGIPKRGIYDNMKTAADNISKGNGRVVNTRFFAMTAHYLFDPDFCNVASGWKKGVVEKRTCRMRGGAPGWMPSSSASDRSTRSIPGLRHAAVPCGWRCRIRTISVLPWPMPRTRAAVFDAHANPVRWLCRGAGAHIQCLSRDRAAEPLLRALSPGQPCAR